MRTFIIVALLVAVTGCEKNTTKPSGANQTGIDGSDKVCEQLKRDLEKSMDQTLRDMKAQGVPSSALPSKAQLKSQFDGPLKANGCSGY